MYISKRTLAVIAGALAAFGVCWLTTRQPPLPEREGVPMGEKVTKTNEEWRQQLTEEQYRVTRHQATEPAFTGAYWNTKDDGVYHCICCGQPLFDAQAKFDSGCGWPSYVQPVDQEHVSFKTDRSWFMVRTEVVCSKCDAHLGHVFQDGPAPTGLRYCINSASLKFDKRSEP